MSGVAKFQTTRSIARITPEWINHRIVSPDLYVADDWVISLRKLPSEGGGIYTKKISDWRLPANKLVEQNLSFVENPEYAAIMVLVVDAYLVNSSKGTHSRTARVVAIFHEMSLILEYLWYNGCLSLRTATPGHFDKLASDFSTGGITLALDIDSRLKGANTLHLHVATSIGTNLVHCQRLLLQRRMNPKARVSFSSLVRIFGNANKLSEIVPELRLKFVPYQRPYVLASRLGAPAESTKNLSHETAGKLLKVAFTWVYERAPILMFLLEELVDSYEESKKKGYKNTGENPLRSLRESPHRAALNELLPIPVSTAGYSYTDSNVMAVRDAIQCAMTACLILIAFMNARRTGEITHPHVGLQVGNLKVVNAPLELYAVSFYLEKGPRHRVPFFVNTTTKDALTLLDDIQRQFGRLDGSYDQGVSLFRTRTFNTTDGLGVMSQYSYNEVVRGNREFGVLAEALGKNTKFGGIKVFRRMHAVMQFYRYENGDIQALNFQMGQECLESTIKYIGDSLSRPEFQGIFDISPSEVEELKRAALDDLQDLKEELEEVGYQKLMEEILIVLNGELVSGGYHRLIRRLALKVAAVVEFHGASKDTAEIVFQAVKARGHFPKVYKHGQCMVGGAAKIKSAKCYSRRDGKLHQESASWKVCGECVYHQTKSAYIRNLEDDLKRMGRRIKEDQMVPFERNRAEVDYENLAQGIQLMRQRMGM